MSEEFYTTSLLVLGVIILIIAIFFFSKWLINHIMFIRHQLQMGYIYTNATHELLTPLTILGATVEKLRINNPEGQNEYDLMDLNIKRSVRLLEQIIENSKSKTGEIKLTVNHGDIMQYIKEAANSIEPLMDSKQVELTVRCKPESMMGWIDTDKIDKIIFNLLSNAAKFAGKGSRVILDATTNRRFDHAIIRISDNGPGIPKDRLRRIFSRFYEDNYKRNLSFGSGLGLSITYDLVRLHKGTISCQSIEGQGTTFIIDIPINKESFSEAQIDDASSISIPSQMIIESLVPEPQQISSIQEETTDENASHILIVEENQELLMLMKQLMQSKYHIYTANNGREALEVIHANPLDLIVSDAKISEINGYELTTIIKQDTEYAHLPIILLITNTQEEDRMEALTAGADDIVSKPFKMKELQLRIDNIIANRQRILGDSTQNSSDITESIIPQQISGDNEYIQRAIKCINEHINDTDYGREEFAADMSNSVSTLYNKIRALTGKNVTTFVREIRIKTACRLAKENPDLRVSDIAYSVGFRDPKYFATSFKRVMGIQPKEYFDQLRTPSQDETPTIQEM